MNASRTVDDVAGIGLLEYYTGYPLGSSRVTLVSEVSTITILGLMQIVVETNYDQGRSMHKIHFPWQQRYREIRAELEDDRW